MRADQYEDAVRIVTGNGRQSAGEFRDGTLGGNWKTTRSGLAKLIKRIRSEVTSLDCFDDGQIQELNIGLDRAIRNLADNHVEETEAAYLAAANITVALKLLANKLATKP